MRMGPLHEVLADKFLSPSPGALVTARTVTRNSSSLEVEHRSYEPGVAGSIPALSTAVFVVVFFFRITKSVPNHRVSNRSCSVTVITGDSESLNPGSIPGRTFFLPLRTTRTQ